MEGYVLYQWYEGELVSDRWLILSGAMLLWSFLGFLPILLLHRPGRDEPKPIRSRQVQRLTRPDGSEIQVEFYGAEHLPTIILTHGWGPDSLVWYYAKKQLTDQFRVIVWDLPGLGKSRKPGNRDYSLERYARDLEAVLSVAGDRPVLLLGHSMGGMILLTFCRLFPEHGIPVDSILELLLRRSIEMPAQLSLPKLKLQLIDIPQVFIHNLSVNPEQVIQSLFTSLKADLRSVLPKIQSPCLIVWSEKDLTTPLTMAQELCQKIKNSRLVTVPEGFYEWALLYPQKFTSIITHFIAQTEGKWWHDSSGKTVHCLGNLC